MASFNNLTSVFQVRLNDAAAPGHRRDDAGAAPREPSPSSSFSSPRRPRARPVVSCHLCRARKQRCDRLLPCGTCTRRGDGAFCRYGGEGGGSSSSGGMGSGAWTTTTTEGMAGIRRPPSGRVATVRQETQARLQKLEVLVHEMVASADHSTGLGAKQWEVPVEAAPQQQQQQQQQKQQQQQSPAAHPRPVHVQPATSVAGILGEAPYAQTTNWAAVLDSIRNIQTYLGVDEGEAEGDGDGEGEGEGGATAEEAGALSAASASASSAWPTPRSPEPVSALEPDIIFATAAGAPFSLDDAVAALPPRADCDRLLAEYFQARFITSAFLHIGQFQRAYSRFWTAGAAAAAAAGSGSGPGSGCSGSGCSGTPGTSPLLWLSMLASMLSIAATVAGSRQLQWMAPERAAAAADMDADAAAPTNADLAQAAHLRRLSTRCLLAGDYLAGRPFAVEALLLNASTRLMQRRDADPALWGAFCVATRLAQRLGYHQVDGTGGGSSGGARLTPFAQEMRRRTWYIIEAYDMLYSFQFGMPTVVHEDETATAPPHNLRDEDFDEDCAVLPPERPAADRSLALYYGCKLRHIRLLRRVVRTQATGSSATAPTRQDTAALFDALTVLHDALPPHLRMPPRIRDCPFGDDGHDVMHRIVLALLYNKAVCILFRGALGGSGGGVVDAAAAAAAAATDRRRCLVSALRILDLHVDFEHETRDAAGGRNAGGRLATERHLFGSLALHDFLLAATILCLDLIEGDGRGMAAGGAVDVDADVDVDVDDHSAASLVRRAASRDAKLAALRSAYALWHDRRLTSRDAAHAARVLGAIVKKLSAEAAAAKEEAAATAATAMTSMTAALSVSTAPVPDRLEPTYDWSAPDPFDTVFADPDHVDWFAVDAFLLDRPDLDGGMVWSADLMGQEGGGWIGK